ncbi:MAG: hypothetical protein CMM76_15245 [Rhodospirillaceae bacterium]|nr:hypothetical protein [Rhodospirillaceae bacterium]
MGMSFDRTAEDLANIVGLEHTNVKVPDQRLATLFYVVGMGFTRDPYMTPGVVNMWMNVGKTQIHMPTGKPQRIPGHTGIIVPDLKSLKKRLEAVKQDLRGTQFKFSTSRNYLDVICPWGNAYRCFPPNRKHGPASLGIRYVEFDSRPGSSEGIARFYREIMGAKVAVRKAGGIAAQIESGYHQLMIFRETDKKIPRYDGHHVQIYLADFSGPHKALMALNLISQESNQFQYRFKNIIDLDSGKKLHTLEHEVRSMTHPLYGRPYINRNPEQTNRNFVLGYSDQPHVLPFEVAR